MLSTSTVKFRIRWESDTRNSLLAARAEYTPFVFVITTAKLHYIRFKYNFFERKIGGVGDFVAGRMQCAIKGGILRLL